MNKVIAQEVLFEAKKILEDLEIPFFLIYGSCLGAVREGKILECDTDIDLGIYLEDLQPNYCKMKEAFEANGFKAFGFSYPYREPRSLNIYKYDILIDIRGFEKWEGGRFLQIVDSNRIDRADVYSFKDVEPIEFCGKEFMAPSPVETYIEENYGKDWKTPDPEMHFSYATKHGWWEKLGRSTIINAEEIKR